MTAGSPVPPEPAGRCDICGEPSTGYWCDRCNDLEMSEPAVVAERALRGGLVLPATPDHMTEESE